MEDRHFWSPELRLTFEEDEFNEFEGNTLVRVMVGPQYTVWVMFVFFYSILGVLSLFGGMYGLSKWSLGIPTAWVRCLPVTLILFLSVYIVAKLGQQTVRDQTLHLVSALYHSIGEGNAERIEL